MNDSEKATVQKMGRLSRDQALLRVAMNALRDVTTSPDLDAVFMTLVVLGFNIRGELAALRKEAGIEE